MLQNRQAADGAALWLRQAVFHELSSAADAGGVGSAVRCMLVGLGMMHTVEGVLPLDAHAITAGKVVRGREATLIWQMNSATKRENLCCLKPVFFISLKRTGTSL